MGGSDGTSGEDEQGQHPHNPGTSYDPTDERNQLADQLEIIGATEGESLSTGQGSLRASAIQGGAYLAAREVAGIVVRAGGIVVVTRLIGPSSYGIFSAASAFAMVIAVVTQMGLEVYLIRQHEEPSDTLYRQVFSFLLVVSVSVSALATLVSLGLVHLISGIAAGQRVFMLLMVSIPLNVLWAPAQAKIERAFGYKRMAWLELGGDTVLYAVAVVLAVFGAGAWSLAVAWVVWQAWLLVGSYWLADLRPGWSWSRSTVRDMLRHGLPYASSGVTATGKGLINPIVVGYFYGSTGVGYVALALRLIDTLGFALRATWRLGLVALSKVRSQTDRLVRGIEQGMTLQLLATAAPVLAACILANWLIPFLFGHKWVPIIPVFAWLAVGRITTAPLTVEFAVLYNAARNTEVAVGTLLNLVLTFVLALVLVPALGINGYAVATVIGIVAWIHVHRTARKVAPFRVWPTIRLSIGLVPVALFPLVPWPFSLLLCLPLVVVCAVPQVHRELLGHVHLVWSGLRKPSGVIR
ncbi:MAG TPA: oligosaccharide flippase family protein [Acidimicrobiales bacterium]|nr:oligosaccharide flippase family protein [Acidimicrobiales bacterium]